MLLLTATTAFGLGKRCQISTQISQFIVVKYSSALSFVSELFVN